MQNIHTHTWSQELHFAPATVRETDISRGFPLNLTVEFDTFMQDMAPFEKVAVLNEGAAERVLGAGRVRRGLCGPCAGQAGRLCWL